MNVTSEYEFKSFQYNRFIVTFPWYTVYTVYIYAVYLQNYYCT